MPSLRKFDFRNTNRPLDVLLHWRRQSQNEGLFLDHTYQRGDVWGQLRRKNFIKSLLIDMPIPSLVVNQRLLSDGWGDDYRIAVIDGRQRITSIFWFVDDVFGIPKDWLDERDYKQTRGDLVMFSRMTVGGQRRFLNKAVPVCEARVSSIEDEKEIFDLINFGGLAQGETDQDL